MLVLIAACVVGNPTYSGAQGAIYNKDETCKCNGKDHLNDDTKSSGFYGPHCTTAGHPFTADNYHDRGRPPHFEAREGDERTLAHHQCFVDEGVCDDEEYLDGEDKITSAAVDECVCKDAWTFRFTTYFGCARPPNWDGQGQVGRYVDNTFFCETTKECKTSTLFDGFSTTHGNRILSPCGESLNPVGFGAYHFHPRVSAKACKNTEQTAAYGEGWIQSNIPAIEFRAIWDEQNAAGVTTNNDGRNKADSILECQRLGGNLADTRQAGGNVDVALETNLKEWAITTHLWRLYRKKSTSSSARHHTFYRFDRGDDDTAAAPFCYRWGSGLLADANKWPSDELKVWAMPLTTQKACDDSKQFAICERDSQWTFDTSNAFEYKWFPEKKTFDDSRAFCKALGGDLIDATDALEGTAKLGFVMEGFQNLIKESVKAAAAKISFWVINGVTSATYTPFDISDTGAVTFADKPLAQFGDDFQQFGFPVICQRSVCSDGRKQYPVGTTRTETCKEINTIGPFRPNDWVQSETLSFIKYQQPKVNEKAECTAYPTPTHKKTLPPCGVTKPKVGTEMGRRATIAQCASRCNLFGFVHDYKFMLVGLDDCDTPVVNDRVQVAGNADMDHVVNYCSCTCADSIPSVPFSGSDIECFASADQRASLFELGESPRIAFIPVMDQPYTECESYTGADGCTMDDIILWEHNILTFAGDYKDVTCIPDEAFKDHPDDLDLSGMINLRTVGQKAFAGAKGKVNLDASVLLEELLFQAFYSTTLEVSIVGRFPALRTFAAQALTGATGAIRVMCAAGVALTPTNFNGKTADVIHTKCQNVGCDTVVSSVEYPGDKYGSPHWEPKQSGAVIRSEGGGTPTTLAWCSLYATSAGVSVDVRPEATDDDVPLGCYIKQCSRGGCGNVAERVYFSSIGSGECTLKRPCVDWVQLSVTDVGVEATYNDCFKYSEEIQAAFKEVDETTPADSEIPLGCSKEIATDTVWYNAGTFATPGSCTERLACIRNLENYGKAFDGCDGTDVKAGGVATCDVPLGCAATDCTPPAEETREQDSCAQTTEAPKRDIHLSCEGYTVFRTADYEKLQGDEDAVQSVDGYIESYATCIEENAFLDFQCTGNCRTVAFRHLELIGASAFEGSDISIDISQSKKEGAPIKNTLIGIFDSAFKDYTGTLTMHGAFENLEWLGDDVWTGATAESTIDVHCVGAVLAQEITTLDRTNTGATITRANFDVGCEKRSKPCQPDAVILDQWNIGDILKEPIEAFKQQLMYNVECIPDDAFTGYTPPEDGATLKFGKKLIAIGASAFTGIDNINIKLTQSIGLTHVHANAFARFGGQITFIPGECALKYLGRSVFAYSSNPNSVIDLTNCGDRLETIGNFAFMKTKAKVRMEQAKYHFLKELGTSAFEGAIHAGSSITPSCVKVATSNDKGTFFDAFKGTVDFAGFQKECTDVKPRTQQSTTRQPVTVFIRGVVDCEHTIDVCGVLCKAHNDRNYKETVAAENGGKECPGAVSCKAGDGGCDKPTDVDCASSQSPCTKECETAEERTLSIFIYQANNGKGCDEKTDCANNDGDCKNGIPKETTKKPTTQPTQKPGTATGGGTSGGSTGGGGGGGGGSSGNGGAIGGAIGGVLLLGAIGVGLVKTGVVGGAASAATSAATAAPAESDSLLGMIF
jgi:uncharacterized membrane protein YgcG